MSNLRIKISVNGVEVELEGDSKLVLSTLDDFRKNGVGSVASSSGSQQGAEKATPVRRGRKPTPTQDDVITETAAEPKRRGRKPGIKAEAAVSAEPKKRGRKPKAKEEIVIAEPKKRGRKPKVKDETVNAESKMHGRKPKVKDETVATEPKKRGLKPGPQKETPAVEPKKRGRPAKPESERKPAKKTETLDLSIPAADYETAVAKSLPRNETEWLLLYADKSMTTWKKQQFTKNDLLSRYKDSGRDNKSKRSNFYNQFKAAANKGMFAPGSDNENYVLTDNARRLLDKVLRRTEGAKKRK